MVQATETGFQGFSIMTQEPHTPLTAGEPRRGSGGAPVPVPMTVITGATEGIGRALAFRFASGAHDLLLIARGEERLAATALEIRARHAVRVETLAIDLIEPRTPSAIEQRLTDLGAFADVLVNSAGVGASGLFADEDPAAVEAVLNLNVMALTRLMRHFLPAMRQRRRGRILNLASLGGMVPGPHQAAYYASKAYVLSLSEAVANEVAGDGVRVCVVAPGPVITGFHAKMGAETAFYRRFMLPMRPETVARWAYRGLFLGARVIVPGVINTVLAVFLRILPHRLVIPIVGLLLRNRSSEA
jgi:short-subunit dehydrogenase